MEKKEDISCAHIPTKFCDDCTDTICDDCFKKKHENHKTIGVDTFYKEFQKELEEKIKNTWKEIKKSEEINGILKGTLPEHPDASIITVVLGVNQRISDSVSECKKKINGLNNVAEAIRKDLVEGLEKFMYKTNITDKTKLAKKYWKKPVVLEDSAQILEKLKVELKDDAKKLYEVFEAKGMSIAKKNSNILLKTLNERFLIPKSEVNRPKEYLRENYSANEAELYAFLCNKAEEMNDIIKAKGLEKEKMEKNLNQLAMQQEEVKKFIYQEENLRKECEKLMKDKDVLKKSLDVVENAVKLKNAELNEQDRECEKQKSMNKRIFDELAAKENAIYETNIKISDCTEKLREMENKKATLANELGKLTREKEVLENDSAKVKKELDENKKKNEDEFKDQKEKITAIEKEKDGLKESLKKNKDDLKELKANYQVRKNELQDVEFKLAQAIKENKKYLAENEKLDARRKKLREDISTLEDDCQKKLNSYEEKKLENDKTIKNFREIESKLNDSIKAIKDERDAAMRLLTTAEREIKQKYERLYSKVFK